MSYWPTIRSILYHKVIEIEYSRDFRKLEELVKTLKIEEVNKKEDRTIHGTVEKTTQYLLCDGTFQVILGENYMKKYCPIAFKQLLRQYKLRMIENGK